MSEQDKQADVSKHTPGPWRTSKNQGSSWEIYTDESWIANVYPGYGQKIETEFRECEANARLIAAAPDLLGIVKDCQVYIERAVESGPACENASEMLAALLAALELAKKGT